MQQFIVPQFIDVEDKIIGPITVRQFVLLLVGAFFMFISYKIFDFGLFLVIFFIILFSDITVAFVRVNGQPFHFFIINFIQTIQKPSLRIWYKKIVREKKDTKKDRKELKEQDFLKKPVRPKELLQKSRLSELSLMVDTGGAYVPEEKILNNTVRQ